MATITFTQHPTKPTERELGNIEVALTKLWELDHNRLEPGRDPTFKAFYAILDNYIARTGIPEVVDSVEIYENDVFIRESLKTAPMQYVFQYLVAKRKIKNNQNEFRGLLNNLWFHMYRREVKGDSSGFEHVFLGEVRNEQAIAFHNWINFYYNEKKGMLRYEGYVVPRSDPHAKVNILHFVVQDIRVNIKVHPLYQGGVRRIGAAYPEIHGHIV
ncbi:928_t:CDS:2 [Ambispora gerdemannii]|uniref:928_t:CDS:1 n=1 Tax=Ambispora gerdemannii TaxID=144530 RepID=A0A9N8YW86_9GLOM|nr:928_t:CDS:2 [Ambispora gerdemannii]